MHNDTEKMRTFFFWSKPDRSFILNDPYILNGSYVNDTSLMNI